MCIGVVYIYVFFLPNRLSKKKGPQANIQQRKQGKQRIQGKQRRQGKQKKQGKKIWENRKWRKNPVYEHLRIKCVFFLKKHKMTNYFYIADKNWLSLFGHFPNIANETFGEISADVSRICLMRHKWEIVYAIHYNYNPEFFRIFTTSEFLQKPIHLHIHIIKQTRVICKKLNFTKSDIYLGKICPTALLGDSQQH